MIIFFRSIFVLFLLIGLFSCADQPQKESSINLEEIRRENMKRIAGLNEGNSADQFSERKNLLSREDNQTGPSNSYGGRIRARIKPNITFSDDVIGNPAAEVEIRATPDGVIIFRKLIKSSGYPAWDQAVLRSIDKTEVIPRDIDGRVFSPIILSMRPKEYDESQEDKVRREAYFKSLNDAKIQAKIEYEKVKKEEEEQNRLQRINAERQRLAKIAEENSKYGLSNMGIFITSFNRECLYREDLFSGCSAYGNNIIVTGSIKNNMNKSVIDVGVRCRHYAQSGTELKNSFGDYFVTIYQRWAAFEIREVRFKINDIEQRHTTKCEVNSWKNG